MSLTPRQRKFCEKYVVCRVGRTAAIEAEYTEHSAVSAASRLLAKPEIQIYIGELETEAAERNKVTHDEVIGVLRDAIEGGKDAKQYGPVVRGAEMLGKSVGMFKNDIELTVIQQASDDDIIKTIARGDPKMEALLRKHLGAPDGFATATE